MPLAPIGAKERILATAYELFSRRGIRAVGIDEVIARSGVAKATLYKYFRTKNDLVLAFLLRREQQWTIEFVQARSAQLADDPEGQLLAIFDVFDDWFRRRHDFDACSFINVLLEMGAEHPIGQAAIVHLANIRAIVAARASAAGLTDPDQFAAAWHILMKGSIISATEGDINAAQHAKVLAGLLIEHHRPDTRTPTRSP